MPAERAHTTARPRGRGRFIRLLASLSPGQRTYVTRKRLNYSRPNLQPLGFACRNIRSRSRSRVSLLNTPTYSVARCLSRQNVSTRRFVDGLGPLSLSLSRSRSLALALCLSPAGPRIVVFLTTPKRNIRRASTENRTSVPLFFFPSLRRPQDCDLLLTYRETGRAASCRGY